MINTGELDAAIIRNITEIEQGHDRIYDEIQGRIDKECGEIFSRVAKNNGWIAKATSLNDDFWMTKFEWQVEEGITEDSDHYLVIAIQYNSNCPDVSWAETLVGGRGAQMLIEIRSDFLKASKWFKFAYKGEANKIVREIISSSNSKIVFDPDNKREPFYRPVRIEQEQLARAFSGDIEFKEALMPLEEALQEILELEELFEKLVKKIKVASA